MAATSAINMIPPAPGVRRERVVFKKRQRGAKLWNRFHGTSLIPREAALEIVEDLRKSHPTMEFAMEVERT